MEEFVYDEMYNEEDKHWWFCAKREIVLSVVQDIYKGQDKKKLDILDAGCGCGYLLHCLQKFGHVQGMDFSEEAIRYSKAHFSGPVLKGDLSQGVPFPPASFDLILLLDVLEHIKEDDVALANLKPLLRPGGHLFITVPAHQFLWSYHDESHMHFRRYSMPPFLRLVQGAGFSSEYATFYNMWLFPPIALVRFIKNMFLKGSKDKSDGAMPGALVNRILYRVFRSEIFFVKRRVRLPFGVSILAILRKIKNE